MSMQVDPPLPLVLVAHRLQDTVELLKTLLEREGYTTLCATNGRSALHAAHQHRPILLLLDQALPLIDGLELCRTLRQEEDDAAIFILSDQSDELGKLLAFAAGADDCLPLPFHPRELLARIRAVLRRTGQRKTDEQRVLRCGALELDPEQRQVRAAGEIIGLTGLEYELLYLLMRHPGRAFARTQLLELIPGFQHHAPLDRAVDIHISNVRRKLSQVMGDDAPIETVRGVGYRLCMPIIEASNAATSTTEQQGRLALAAFEHAPLPLLVLTADRTVVLYNEAARRLCGWPADQVVGQVKCYSLLSCHDEEGRMLCKKDCILRTGTLNSLDKSGSYREQTTQYRITLKDGREVSAAAHYSNLGAEDGYMLLTLEPDLASTRLP
jgi:DNA-binding response OmpR family regulator